jgi:hypothetical protein
VQALKKPLPKYYFTKFLKNISNENLLTLCELLAIEIAKLQRRLYTTLGRRAWVPQNLLALLMHMLFFNTQ